MERRETAEECKNYDSRMNCCKYDGKSCGLDLTGLKCVDYELGE